MTKTYKANTNVSINVVLPSKKSLHLSFTPLSDGSSTFTTDNEEIMRAIESHYNFGKLFRLHNAQDKGKKRTAKPNGNPEEKGTAGAEGSETSDTHVKEVDAHGGGDHALKRVKVSDLSAAKDYLADTLGISRTALRGVKSITEQAAANGIEFVGLT